MKRSLFFTALFVCALFSSCQCADPPDVGPVEGQDEESAQVRLDDRADRSRVA
jgi:hypothetical protein